MVVREWLDMLNKLPSDTVVFHVRRCDGDVIFELAAARIQINDIGEKRLEILAADHGIEK